MTLSKTWMSFFWNEIPSSWQSWTTSNALAIIILILIFDIWIVQETYFERVLIKRAAFESKNRRNAPSFGPAAYRRTLWHGDFRTTYLQWNCRRRVQPTKLGIPLINLSNLVIRRTISANYGAGIVNCIGCQPTQNMAGLNTTNLNLISVILGAITTNN